IGSGARMARCPGPRRPRDRAAQSGAYTFWIASDDSSELWLSPDDNPAHRILIASVSGWTSPREWSKFPSQQSVPLTLTAGGRYYLEVLHKEGGGKDNLAVGWQMPDGTLERPIPGSRLSPVDPLDGDGDGVSDADEIAAGTDPLDKDSYPRAPRSGSDSHDRRCGATGIEGVLLAIFLLKLRRTKMMPT
ncbi:MAG: PA14 domain-containing protein, partial [Planctomycetota bacterium]